MIHTTFSHQSFWQHTLDQPARASDSLPPSVDVAVIGGGLLGTATSYWLARAGASVALIERTTLAAGATGRNGGLMVAGTSEPYPATVAQLGHAHARAIWALTLENRELLRQVLADEVIDCDYCEVGHLHLAIGEQQLEQAAQSVAALHGDGFAATLLDRAQVQRHVDTPLGAEIAGGVWTADNGVVHSARLVHGLAGAAQRHGAQLCAGTEVTSIRADSAGVLIETNRGALRAGSVVVAVNAWSEELLPQLRGVITPVRGQVLAYAPSASVFSAGMSAALTPTGEYWQQRPDSTIVLGGCRAVAPDGEVGQREPEANAAVQTALDQVLPRLFPALAGLQVARRWAGPMAFTDDHTPIADAVPGLPGAWLVGGFSGHGMPFGLVLGRLLAAAATGERPTALAPFRLDRTTLAARL